MSVDYTNTERNGDLMVANDSEMRNRDKTGPEARLGK